MNISCNVIDDLLPLYAENLTSEESKQLVEEHLMNCEGCSKQLAALRRQSMLREAGTTSLRRVKQAIRRRRMLAVLSVFLFLTTFLAGGALLLDAQIFLSAEEAVKEVCIEGDTVRIIWDSRVIGTGAQTDPENHGNYAVTAWTNLQMIIHPADRIPYDQLDEEIKEVISRQDYDSMDSTSTYSLVDGINKTNFWYCDLSNGTMKLILDKGMPHPDGIMMKDGNRVRTYVLGSALLCALCMFAGAILRRKWQGELLIRLGILTGSCCVSALIVTAGQLVDIYGRFTEMLVDSTVVAIPMALCGMCVFQLVKLNRQDKGL